MATFAAVIVSALVLILLRIPRLAGDNVINASVRRALIQSRVQGLHCRGARCPMRNMESRLLQSTVNGVHAFFYQS